MTGGSKQQVRAQRRVVSCSYVLWVACIMLHILYISLYCQLYSPNNVLIEHVCHFIRIIAITHMLTNFYSQGKYECGDDSV